VLTFTSPQGVKAVRTLPCSAIVAGTPAPNPSPSPNAPHLTPNVMLAHWSGDAGPLRFKAAEFGYTHWYASATGDTCATVASDTGAPPARFAAGWPYSLTESSAQASPNPPAGEPYSWPDGDPNDPPALFVMTPVPGNGGLCTVRIVDDYGQEADGSIQVMGDLTASANSLTFASPAAAAQSVAFTKTFDSQNLALVVGGDCVGVVTAAQTGASTPAAPSSLAARATLTITPKSSGSCTLIVQDEYGERASIAINVRSKFDTWPEQLSVGQSGARVSPSPCFAYALTSGGAADPLPNAIAAWANAAGVFVDNAGCFTDAGGTPVSGTDVVIAYEPSSQSVTFNIQPGLNTCSGRVAGEGAWDPSETGMTAALPVVPGATAGSCQVAMTDGLTTTPTIDHGLAEVNVAKGYTIQLLATGCGSDIASQGGAVGNGISNCVVEEGLPTTYVAQYVWTAFAVPSGEQISLPAATCTQYGFTGEPPNQVKVCLAYSTPVPAPADAVAFCDFETQSAWSASSATGIMPADWTYYQSGSMQQITNTLGYSCSSITIGSSYLWILGSKNVAD
jgi:hypothetical protein